MNEQDRLWMLRALELAERGRGFVEPNPLVGAVVVRDGRIVGEGWHERYGLAHAEVNALAAAGEAARQATLYVTLEPCCHHGKTPPCTDAVLRAGVRRLVAAMVDPFPQVSGQGAAVLRAAGIMVDVGLCETEARRLNAPYLKLLTTGRPYVHLKWAMTLDGKICTRTGDSKWISNEASRQRVHELRGRMDAIVVGIGTVLADDPLLTARPPGPRVATRVVLDSRCRLPLDSQLVRSARAAPVLLVTSKEGVACSQARLLAQAGVEILEVRAGERGPEVRLMLDALGQRRMTNVLVEGGAAVLGSFVDAEQWDEVLAFIAPRIVGAGKAPVAGKGVDTLAHAIKLAECHWLCIDGDCVVHGRRAAAG